jgi:hypothetical protein
MSFSLLIDALAIPDDARVELRVPKKLLAEQGAPTAADKRQIQDGIEEITWVAALKPTNIGVPAYRDDAREYLEVAVLTAVFRPEARAGRLLELIHRAIPYPVVLVSEDDDGLSLSLAHKRWSQGESGAVVVEDCRKVTIPPGDPSPWEQAFLGSLAVSQLPARDLYAFYGGLLKRLAALEAARITGAFAPPDSVERAAAVRAGLDERRRIERELATLRAQVKREKQLNRRVELNLQIKRLETQLDKVSSQL